MAHAPPAADLHQALDVHRDLLAEIPFDPALLLDDAADLAHVVFGQVLDPDVRADLGRVQDVVRALPPDPVDVGQPYFDPLGSRKVNASNACHKFFESLSAISSQLETVSQPAAVSFSPAAAC